MAVSSTFVAADGDGYELQMGRWSRRLAPLLIDFAGVVAGERVLDAGCGTGNLAVALAQNPSIGHVSGVDLSTVYVEHAKRHSSNPRINFQVADVTALPFADATFDHSLSMLVLQFVPQSAVALQELRRVTRPGGTIAAATWDIRGGFVAYRMVFDAAAMLDSRGSERRARNYTRQLSKPGDLEAAWRHAGLVDVVQDMRTIRMDFASFADFWAPAEGRDGPIAEYVMCLDEAARTALRDAVQKAYLDGEADGPRSYAATAWVVKGRVPG